MSQKTLVTSGETSSTITNLGALADNLNEHVNASMAKAHGWTIVPAQYFDSGGCLHTSPLDGTNHGVVRMVIGSQVFFVPAQLAGGLDGQPDVIVPVSTGVVSPQSADPSQDLTVGSPTMTALTTTFAALLDAISANSSALLFSHAGSPPDLVHGGLTVQTEATYDNAAHLVAHQTINILVNGVPYKLIANPTAAGITQAPNITSTCPQVETYALTGDNFYQTGPCSWFDVYQGAGFIRAILKVTVTGTPPIKYQWQGGLTTNQNGSWFNLVEGNLNPANAGFSWYVMAPGYIPGDPRWQTNPTSGIIYQTPAVLRIGVANNGSHGNATNLAYAVRLKLDNTSLRDGVITNSGIFVMGIQDQHGGGC